MDAPTFSDLNYRISEAYSLDGAMLLVLGPHAAAEEVFSGETASVRHLTRYLFGPSVIIGDAPSSLPMSGLLDPYLLMGLRVVVPGCIIGYSPGRE